MYSDTPASITSEAFPGSSEEKRSFPSPRDFTEAAKALEEDIHSIAFKHACPWCTLEELVQTGLIAVWNATKGFDHIRGPFSHYARRAIKLAMIREFGKCEPASDARAELTPLSNLHSDHVGRCSQDTDMRNAAVRDWIASLPQPLKHVYHYLYVLGYTQRDTAEILGVSQLRICHIHHQLLKKGRKAVLELAA